MPCLLLTITIRFTCGDTKILSNIKMSQNIMTRIVQKRKLSNYQNKNQREGHESRRLYKNLFEAPDRIVEIEKMR